MQKDDEDRRSAALIAADAALSALEASGAPVLAAYADPFRIAHVNATAREIFGDAETIRRIFDHIWPESARLDALARPNFHSDADEAQGRLKRTMVEIDGESKSVTVMRRMLTDADGARYFVLAFEDLRSADVGDHGAIDELRSQLMRRFGSSSLRFLWKTDAQDRFVAVDPVLADVIGVANLTGSSVEEAARGLVGGAALIRALGSRCSWSGVRVEWPIYNGTGVAPITLGALPSADEEKSFGGYNGYGLIHIALIRASEQSVSQKTVVDATSLRATNVVPLRPILPAIPQPASPASPWNVHSDPPGLSESELSAFAEIGRTLVEEDATPPESLDACSSRRTADQAAEESQALSALTRALELLPIGVLVARGAQTLFVNQALLRELGYVDKSAFAQDGGLARIFLGRSSLTTGALPDDIDAHVDTIDWGGAPATMISFTRAPSSRRASVTEEIETKLARMRTDNTMLRAVIDALDGAVAILDEFGRIESATMAFATLLGAEKGAFDGQPLSSVFRLEDASELITRLQRAESGRKECFLLTPRQSTPPLEAQLSRLPGDAGKIYLLLRAPAAPFARNHEAARLAAERANITKSNFLACISHEIRTPLSAIIGFTEVMIDERFGPVGAQRYKEYLKDIHSSGTHVLSLVNDLLDISKIEAGKMELCFVPIDANAVIVECMSIMQPQANRKRVVMRQALALNLPIICADTRALRQILFNLLSNAVKFTPAGGQVIVSSTSVEAGQVLIRVKDTGIGMSEEETGDAFEPFTQISLVSDMPGTGLGLPLTKSLVEASGGAMTIKSRRHEGTLVEIAFPSMEVCAAE